MILSLKSNKSLIIILLLVLFVLGCNSNHTDKNAEIISYDREEEHYNNLEKLYNGGKFDICLYEAKLFLDEYPNNSFGWGILAGTYMMYRNDSLDSLAWLGVKRSLDLDSINSIALLNKAILLDRKGEYEEAANLYDMVIEINPEVGQVYSNYAGNRLKVKDYKLAVKYGEMAVKIAGKIQDKGVLCMSYHFTREYQKRDSLFNILENQEYTNLVGLKKLFERKPL
jgi:tetratricopeptide (TPR) repeat protein